VLCVILVLALRVTLSVATGLDNNNNILGIVMQYRQTDTCTSLFKISSEC